MAVIYIKEQGTTVRKLGGRIAVEKNSQALMEFPVSNIEGLALMGSVQLTTQALHFLLKQGIDISYYTYGGNILDRPLQNLQKISFYVFPSTNFTTTKRKDLILPKLLWLIRLKTNFR